MLSIKFTYTAHNSLDNSSFIHADTCKNRKATKLLMLLPFNGHIPRKRATASATGTSPLVPKEKLGILVGWGLLWHRFTSRPKLLALKYRR